MNRPEARKRAQRGITVAEARALFAGAQARGLTGPSRVNKGLTKQQAFDILSVVYEDKPDTYVICGLVAQNILREFG